MVWSVGRRMVRGAVVVAVSLFAGCEDGPVAPVRVEKFPRPAGSVEIQPVHVDLTARDTARLMAVVRDHRGDIVSAAVIQWSSRDTTLVTVDSSGLATARPAVETDTALVIAIAGGRLDTATIEVRTAVTSVVVDHNWADLVVGDTVRFHATIRDDLGDVMVGARARWSSRDTSVLTIDSSGLATARATGRVSSTVVTAAAGEQQDTVPVTVRLHPLPAGTYDVWPDTNVVFPGMTRQLRARVSQSSEDLYPQPVEADWWTSSDSSVVTVDAAGNLVGVAVGEAFVTATLGQQTLSARVYVLAGPGPLRFVEVADGAVPVFQDANIYVVNRGCGVDTKGDLYCWGYPLPGIEGPYDRCETIQKLLVSYKLRKHRCGEIPRRVPASAAFTDLSFHGEHGCAITSAGSIQCWGRNTGGQLGIGSADNEFHLPTPIAAGGQFRSVHAASNTPCAIRTDGVGLCWGSNVGDATGTGSSESLLPTPAVIAGNHLWSTIAEQGRCGIVDGVLYCWGDCYFGTPNMYCPPERVLAPKALAAPTQFTAVAGTCALSVASRLFCWGPAIARLLSFGAPTAVAGGLELRFVGMTSERICALDVNGSMHCLRASLTTTMPEEVYSLEPFDLGAIRLKRFSGNCGIGTDDRAYCWAPSMAGVPTVVRALPGQ